MDNFLASTDTENIETVSEIIEEKTTNQDARNNLAVNNEINLDVNEKALIETKNSNEITNNGKDKNKINSSKNKHRFNKKNGYGILIGLVAIIGIIITIITSAYLYLDKIIIPNKFGMYGINSVKDLTGVFSSLYSSPKESSLIINGYSEEDLESAVYKLKSAGYKIEDNGTILHENIPSFKGDGTISLTDREFAAICNNLAKSGILSENLPNLNYVNTMNISVLDLVMTIDEDSLVAENGLYSKANIKLLVKIDTDDICSQIAVQMQTTEALLKIIIPSSLYFTVDYDIDLSKQDENRTTGTIAINGKTDKQSEVLINLLIEFIFPKNDNMTYDNFTKAIGDVVLSGIDELGSFYFDSNVDNLNKNGIIVN